MFARADEWVAKTLYYPLIIKWCHVTNQSHYRLGNYAWMLATLVLFYDLSQHDHIAASLMAGLVGVAMIAGFVMYGRDPDRQGYSGIAFFRYVAFILIPFAVLELVVLGRSPTPGDAFWPLMLLHDYANMIDRIPPKKAKEKKTKLVHAEARG